MRILITGGTGFIGSHLANHFSDEGHEVIVVGTKTEQSPKAAKYLGLTLGGFDFNRLQRLGKIDVCFHQAANNDTLDLDRDEMMWANLESPKKFLKEVCGLNGCRKIIYASSSAVYGSSPAPYKEGETAENPLNPYGESKAEFDKWAMNWRGDFFGQRVEMIGLRYTNVYGPGEEHKGRRASMIHQLIQTMKKGDSPKLFKDGTQQRDWVYIKDVVRANVAALAYQGSGVFNCGSGKATSFNTLVEIINNKLRDKYAVRGTVPTEVPVTWIDCPFKEAYQDFTQADMTKAKEVLGFHPAYGIDRGISDFLGAA